MPLVKCSVKGIVQTFRKYFYLLPKVTVDENIDTTVMFVTVMLCSLRSYRQEMVSLA